MQQPAEFRQGFWPRVPSAIRDELALLRFSRLTAQVPTLYATLISVICIAMLAAPSDTAWPVRAGLPLFIAGVGTLRFVWWVRKARGPVAPDHARRRICRMLLLSLGITSLSSLWCLISWSQVRAADHNYFPLFMAMGTLAMTFSLSSIRMLALVNLLLGIGPICTGLLVWGCPVDKMAGSTMLIATVFLIRMILDQHDQLVDLLMLKHQLREQANTDPLTGLLNRRALIAMAESAFAHPQHRPAVALIDLDGFKAVNDRYGHAAGDQLLIQVAQRMARVAGTDAAIARLGGDEFALFMPSGNDHDLAKLVDGLLAAFVPHFNIDAAPVRLGASAGLACAPHHGDCLTGLMSHADRALYAAKAALARPAVQLVQNDAAKELRPGRRTA